MWDFLSAYTCLSAYRLAVGVPLDIAAAGEVLTNKTALEFFKSAHRKELMKGAQPGLIKYVVHPYVQAGSTYVATRVTPAELPPALRGVCIGVITAVIDSIAKNSTSSLRTHFLEGGKWSVVRTDPQILFRGLGPTLLQRTASYTIFWGLYEQLRHQFPEHPLITASVVGQIQVVVTAPFFGAAVIRQSHANPERDSLVTLLKRNLRLILTRGTSVRAFHSALTTAPVMYVSEKYLIHRA